MMICFKNIFYERNKKKKIKHIKTTNMDRLKQAKEQIKYELKIYNKEIKILGGQSAGMPNRPVIIESEYIGVKIEISEFKSNIKNREYGLMLFELIIDDLIK